MSGKLLSRAREKLDELRAANEKEQQRRTAEVYARLPRVREIDCILRAQMLELMGLTIRRSGNPLSEIAELEKENLDMQAERAELLVGAGWPMDYTDEIFSCPKCRDTGMVNGAVCSCLKKLYNRELTAELGTLLRCGNESFSLFDLSLYDTAPDPATGIVPRECMKLVYDTCFEYAKNFGSASSNLVFQGGPGLGKTFLSACIARVAAEKGFSVAYESASAALEAFEVQKFSRDPEEAAAAASRVRQYLSCDLMILDDLGTEMITSFSTSALYNIINSRLIGGKKTIISTNYGDDELRRKYTPQITSRLEGEYLTLPFIGRDIRIIRKERGE
ncbi:MAG: DNA replication protein DnaC [Clostridia bacterium]|nr:DNA replication protein DnaC [Clostridia bacterium]